ncbi:hypothetical protein [Bradyrhizobium sp. CB3481]|uniref:hypothetical protein n=1 Tax=Bradyrhizobium sp. CB3481 TaxID=3039158 RepID=UPI0024B0C70E|nr:hypothetical protein [Bradyrhizobium sp. CB3481]WFU16202.1 hypothetical protein QA643_35520 [Bradyrhizobium sp. CB3481]
MGVPKIAFKRSTEKFFTGGDGRLPILAAAMMAQNGEGPQEQNGLAIVCCGGAIARRSQRRLSRIAKGR